MENKTKTYEYRPKWSLLLLGILFFSGCSAFIAYEAYSNNRGLIINRIIKLDISEATVFLWILCSFGILLVCMGVIGVVVRLINPKTSISLNQDFIELPTGFLIKKKARVEFSRIIELQDRTVYNQVFFEIKTNNKKYSISRSLLPNHFEYEELRISIIKSYEKACAFHGRLPRR